MKYQIIKIPSGDAGTDETVRQMGILIDQGVKSPLVRRTALRILEDVPAHDPLAEVQAIYEWVKDNIRFTMDPWEKEMIHNPDRILELKAGDCDDFTILLSSLLRSVGYETRTKVTGSNIFGGFHHVYPQVNVNGQWVSLDATDQYNFLGYEPVISKSKIYSGGNDMRLGTQGFFNQPVQALRSSFSALDPVTRVFQHGEGVSIPDQELIIRDRVLTDIRKNNPSIEELDAAVRAVQNADLPFQVKRGFNKAVDVAKHLRLSGLGSQRFVHRRPSRLLSGQLGWDPWKSIKDGVSWIWDQASKVVGVNVEVVPKEPAQTSGTIFPGVTYSIETAASKAYSFLTSPLGLGLLGVGFFLLLKKMKKI